MQHCHTPILFVALLAVWLCAACQSATFSEVQAEILTPSCAAEGCHSSFLPERGLDLSDGNAYAALVDVAAEEPDATLVVPGDPERSLLYTVLEVEAFGDGEDQPATLGLMPPRAVGAAGLSAAKQTMIRSWIADGAMNN